MIIAWFLRILGLLPLVLALNNGLARTPPMGWLSWQRFRCNTDCKEDPYNCISEDLYRQMADHLVNDGYAKLGYKYVNIDDCWMSMERGPDGRLQADPDRFPHGIKYLADYMHSKGLKLGIYEDFGTKTCGGYPGSKFYLELDAETFADWGVDMLKLDGCYTDTDDMAYGYPAMGFFLNKTGRPILYSCSWPAYIFDSTPGPDYQEIANFCNIWRNYDDIDDSWDSVKNIIEFYANDKGNFTEVAGPGNFNDPDMIIVGNYGLSYDQEKVQMALWAIMAAPLFMSNDLRNIRPESMDLLQNPRIIMINQDYLGIQGRRILKMGNIEIWTKPMVPEGKSKAYAVLNLSSGGGPTKIDLPFETLGLTEKEGYNVTEVFSGKYLGVFSANSVQTIWVNPSGVYLGFASFDP
ncbi:hypothetical protein CHS0354_018637 [Potamilus streckersoni]|uniref:Alpha-galactosidase n=1 Tax=Potamilus streckersoni TaxID=2493646 RepID=A0AAE0VY61_9BIVA|nr:hypothetical protein CHS0354_018637 [Potamilus streckersoni]